MLEKRERQNEKQEKRRSKSFLVKGLGQFPAPSQVTECVILIIEENNKI